ncbi:MAG: methyl-accepting chemotaxis protein, partial [Alkalibacterium sp.]|uniref:methyl-accepting chemotaxis protein n=1 Tax=Alkalibacterium sp. TaxID=1872447 RepID=UPI0039708D35
QGAEQIAITMQELASGSESQANYTSDLSENMHRFVQTIEASADQSDRIYKTSNDVRALTEKGSGLMDASVSQMQMIDKLVKHSVEGVKELDNKSAKVSKLVSVIEGIAEQTNLLALNAAIEAARAGEQGKGFAVVAEEVRKLAEQVSHSVVDITDIVNSIQQESSAVAANLETGYEQVAKGTTQIENTGETFNKISSSVQAMGLAIKEISDKLKVNKTQTIEMSSSVEEIASVSEESAAGIEQTSASAQQTTSTMQEVSASSEELARIAEELNQLVDRFTL